MRYILNYRTFLMLVFAGMIGMTGCKKSFLDVNDDPNRVTESNITPELIFPAAAVQTAARTASGNFTFLDNWMGYLSTAGDYAIDQQQTSYNIDFGFGQALWQNHYNVLFDLEQTRTRALAKGDSVLAGASMILSVKLWQELVDLYGNIPFTDAFHVEKTTRPAYDKDSTVYRLLHQQLDQAISYMKGTPRATFSTVVGNIVKFGATQVGVPAQQTSWIKFANTLKLRLLIRTSEVTLPGINRAAELAKITANGGVLQTGQTVNVNPGYANETGKQSPFYGNYAYTPTNTDANAIARASVYSVNLLSGDPRLTRFYRPLGSTATTQGTGAVVGTRYGQTVPANPFGNASSKVGFGTAASATQDQWILTSVESLFLQAEAVQRGWLPGTPAVAYSNAVVESFRWLKVPGPVLPTSSPDSSALAYVTSHPYTDLNSLLFQKYLALNQIDPLESYSDLRRSNFTMLSNTSYISVNPSRLANKLPNRLLYPQEEYTLNSENVNAQGTINTSTIFTGSKIFWQP